MAVLALREYWYVAAATKRLGRKKPLSTRVLDQDLVLFRDRQGVAHALLDRCCHRGVKLSLGRVVNDTVACRYHGWQFDGQGQCVKIPSLTAAHRHPSNFSVPSRPCVEKHSYLWVWMGDGEPGPVPGVPRFDEFRWRQGTVHMACAAIKGLENNVDLCHPFWTHPFTHPHWITKRFTGFKDDIDEVRLTRDGMVVFKPHTAAPSDPIPAQPQGVLTFTLPDRLEVWFPKPGMHTAMCFHFVPTGPDTCRMEWMWSKSLPLGRRVRFESREPLIFKQDRVIMESSQGWYDGVAASWERSVEADRTTRTLRKVVTLAAQGRWEAERDGLESRWLVRSRK